MSPKRIASVFLPLAAAAALCGCTAGKLPKDYYLNQSGETRALRLAEYRGVGCGPADGFDDSAVGRALSAYAVYVPTEGRSK